MSRILLSLAFIMTFFGAVHAAETIKHLTIYDAGVAEFLEERTLELQPGTNTIEWRSLMPKAFVGTIRVTAENADVLRQDITYDGTEVRNEKSPVLHLVIQNKGVAGPRKIQVDYLAPGLRWSNDYALVLEPTAEGLPPTAALLDAWVSLFNQTGTDITADTVDLVAGEVALLLGDNEYQSYRRDNYALQQVANVANASADNVSGDASAEVSGISAFSRFRLGRNITMKANAPVNRLPLFQRAKLALTQRNVFENSYSDQTQARGGFMLLPRGLEVRLAAKNTTGRPLPAGKVTIYARTAELAQVVGQDRLALVPANGEFSVAQGRSSTLLGTRRVVERDSGSGKLVTRIEIVIFNRGTQSAEAFIRDGIEGYRNNRWDIVESSAHHEKMSANAAQFKVTVPANDKVTLSYTVESQ